MEDRKMELMAKHKMEHEDRAECEEALSRTQTNSERHKTKSSYRKYTIQLFINIPASTLSNFTSCCIMRNQFSSLDRLAKTALKYRK
jgi:hypothetical protein